MKRRLRFIIVLLALSMALGACSDEGRPAVPDWRPAWNAIVAVVPSPAELGTPPDSNLCSQALGELRSLSRGLTPSPDLAIDSVVEEWVRVAEEMMFECPPSSQKIPDFQSGYGELARLEAEVAVVLQLDESG